MATSAEERGVDSWGWKPRLLGAAEVEPADAALAACKVGGGASLQRLLNEFHSAVSRATLAVHEGDRLPPHGLDAHAQANVAREMVHKSLVAMVAPACEEFSRRCAAIVRAQCEAAHRKSVATASHDDAPMVENMRLWAVGGAVVVAWVEQELLDDFRASCAAAVDRVRHRLDAVRRHGTRGALLQDTASLMLQDYALELPDTLESIARQVLDALCSPTAVSGRVFADVTPNPRAVVERVFNAPAFQGQMEGRLADVRSHLGKVDKLLETWSTNYAEALAKGIVAV